MDTKDTKPTRIDVYKRTPTFTLPLELLEEFRANLDKSIKANRLMLMSDGRTLLWIEELIEKEKKVNPPEKDKI